MSIGIEKITKTIHTETPRLDEFLFSKKLFPSKH